MWLDHPHLCFEALDTEYVNIEGWHYFYEWDIAQPATNIATSRCNADWDLLHHYTQHIFIDQTQSDYWTVYFVVYWL